MKILWGVPEITAYVRSISQEPDKVTKRKITHLIDTDRLRVKRAGPKTLLTTDEQVREDLLSIAVEK
jgi:hypothetical protein